MNLGDTKNQKDWRGKTALEIVRVNRRTEVVSLLERSMANPAQTRHEVRGKLGVLDALAAELFAVVVFLSDDLLQPRPALATIIAASAATRFFAITSKLPMELQMILCHRVVGSMKQNILYKDSEVAFKSLAKCLPVATPLSPIPEVVHPVSSLGKHCIMS